MKGHIDGDSGVAGGGHAHLLRSILARERLQKLPGGHRGWDELAVHRTHNGRLPCRNRREARRWHDKLGVSRLSDQLSVPRHQLARLLPQPPLGRDGLSDAFHPVIDLLLGHTGREPASFGPLRLWRSSMKLIDATRDGARTRCAEGSDPLSGRIGTL